MTTTARLRRFAAIGLLVCTAAVTGCAADTDSPGSDTGQQTAETPGPRSDYDRCVLKMFDIIDRALVDLAGGAGISEVTDRADDQAGDAVRLVLHQDAVGELDGLVDVAIR